jgi:hypothetical protein
MVIPAFTGGTTTTANSQRPGPPHGIDALVAAHYAHAGGESCILHADPDLYISQRGGTESQRGSFTFLIALGINGSAPLDKNQMAQSEVRPVAWDGKAELIRMSEVRNFQLHHEAIACMLR